MLMSILIIMIFSCTSTQKVSNKSVTKQLPIKVNYLTKENIQFGSIISDSLIRRGYKIISRQEMFELGSKPLQDISKKNPMQTSTEKTTTRNTGSSYSKDIATIFAFSTFYFDGSFVEKVDSISFAVYPLNSSSTNKPIFKTFKPSQTDFGKLIQEFLNVAGF